MNEIETGTHLRPYKVAWVDKTTMQISKRCWVLIQFATYKDRVWCNVLIVDVSYILFERPWLDNSDVVHYRRSNMSIFRHDRNKIVLNLPKPPYLRKNEKWNPNLGHIVYVK